MSRSPLRRLPMASSSPKRASTTHLSPPRFTRGEADQSAGAARAALHLGPLGFTPRGAGRSESAARAALERSDTSAQTRALMLVAVAAATAPSGFIHAKASESGHLKRSFSSPPVASARRCRGRRCGGSLWRGQHQSERAERISARRDSLAARLTRARARQEPRSSAQTRALKQADPADRSSCRAPTPCRSTRRRRRTHAWRH